MALLRKKNRANLKHNDTRQKKDTFENQSDFTANIDLSSIPDDMTIEEVLIKYFKAKNIEEHSDGTLSFTTT